MRITREALMKVVRDTVSQRTRSDRSLLSIYLCGSLLKGEFILGGTADIDLVIIHTDQSPVEREIIHLTDDVHLDISHHTHKDYRQTRNLRVHPWLGPTLKSCMILHDPQHFLDFTQASVRGQFDRSDFVLERARKQAEHARQIWVGFHEEQPPAEPKEISAYLRAVEHAANAVASLSGPPLTERRFLMNFPQRAQAVGKPGLSAGLLGLLGAPNTNPETLRGFLSPWQAAYKAVPVEAKLYRLHPLRISYYLKAFKQLLDSDQPMAALMPLLRTWTLAISVQPSNSPFLDDWHVAMENLGLHGDGFLDRVAAMDVYLDQVEETLDQWAIENGA